MTDNQAARAQSLGALMDDLDPRVRKSCVVALGKMEGMAAVDLLCRALTDVDEGVRVLACQALGRKSGEECTRAIPALIARVHDGSREVRSGILWVLANAVAHGGLGEQERAALFTPVTVMAFDPDDGVRADAAAVLGTLRDPRATDALSVLLEDENARVRANACSSLALTDDSEGLDLVLGRIEEAGEDPLVTVASLDALARRCERGSVDGPRAQRGVRAVLASVGSRNPDVVATAVWTLGFCCQPESELRGEVQSALEAALLSGEEWPARYAAESLARIHDDLARSALEKAEGLGEPLAPVVAQALQTFK